MPILKTIVTTTAQILDPDGAAGFGNVKIRPNSPFEYFDGVSTISVSDATTEITVLSGKLDSTLQLQPNTGATNNPETYYIVDIDVNGTTRTIYWQIDSATASPIEFSDVAQLPGPDASEAPITAHVQATNPHNQYVLKSDTADAAQTGTASDGRGYIPRLDPTSGQLPKDMYVGGTGGIEADDVPITDAGGYYTGTEVEAALQEVGVKQGTQDTAINLKAPIDSPNFTTTAQIAGNTILTTASTGINAATLDGDSPAVSATGDTIARRDANGRSQFEDGINPDDAVNLSQFTSGLIANPFLLNGSNHIALNVIYSDIGTTGSIAAGGYTTISVPAATTTNYHVMGVVCASSDIVATLAAGGASATKALFFNPDVSSHTSAANYLILIPRSS